MPRLASSAPPGLLFFGGFWLHSCILHPPSTCLAFLPPPPSAEWQGGVGAGFISFLQCLMHQQAPLHSQSVGEGEGGGLCCDRINPLSQLFKPWRAWGKRCGTRPKKTRRTLAKSLRRTALEANCSQRSG